MNLVELDHALRKLRLSGMAAVLETRLRQAQTERLAPLDLVATLVSDELQRRQDRLFERRHKQAGFRDTDRSLDRFDFDFNKKMNRALIHELATARFIGQREDALFSAHRARQEPSRPSDWARRHPTGLPRHLPRSPYPHRGDRRRHAGRHPQSLAGGSGDRAPADHRRPRDAEASAHGRRGSARADHAPI